MKKKVCTCYQARSDGHDWNCTSHPRFKNRKRKSLTVKIQFKRGLRVPKDLSNYLPHGTRLDGLYRRRSPAKTAYIYLDKDLQPRSKLETLIHELIHLSVDFDSIYNQPSLVNLSVEQEEKFCENVTKYVTRELDKLHKPTKL